MGNSFDPVANIYDNTFSNSVIGQAQREIVWNYLLRKNLVDLNILELNCGTGVDAIFLSEKNRVTATDASPEMLKITYEKIKQINFELHCKTIHWNLNDPFPEKINEKYDLIFSNFGGLNCLSAHALNNLSSELNTLLKPGGKMIFVIMGKFCLMETIYFFLKGKWKSAFRRNTSKMVLSKLSEDIAIPIYYYSPRNVKNIFRDHFVFQKMLPVGIVIPPTYMETFFKNKRALFRFFVLKDKLFRKFPFFARMSDHYLIEFKKKGEN